MDALVDCEYLPKVGMPFDHRSTPRPVKNGGRGTEAWIRNPILEQTYRARPLFDLRPIHGADALWQTLEGTVTHAADRGFLRILANDCLASLPPLTFFQDAVVDDTGGESPVFVSSRARSAHSSTSAGSSASRPGASSAGRHSSASKWR